MTYASRESDRVTSLANPVREGPIQAGFALLQVGRAFTWGPTSLA